MDAFLGMTEIHRIPWRGQLRQKCKALLHPHNARVFSKRWWQWTENVFVTVGEFANVCTCHGDGVPRNRMQSFREGFSSLEPCEASVSNPSRSTPTKTDLAGPHLRSLTQNLQGEKIFFNQMTQVIVIIRQVWEALPRGPETPRNLLRGNLPPQYHL